MINKRAILSLFLLIPLPSLGVYFGMIAFPNSLIGQGLFFCMKALLLMIPIFWTVVIDKDALSLSKPQKGGFFISGLIGLFMSFGIVVSYLVLGNLLIDTTLVQSKMADVGLSSPVSYFFGAAYWVLVNSVLEEYVWRWFVVQQAEKCVGPISAILISAAGFTLHHVLALQLYFNWVAVFLCAIGIFFGGAVWSWCYIKFRSIWPCYFSHAIVDVAVFVIGFQLIFG
ncbi:MAG: type II CAAX endopeptidase family protein [Candidatus Margulisiibacteriota bacterium]|nr:type II CAAX endopeptidase family protein [Candidatus Margulisiibacteriota bacterium]